MPTLPGPERRMSERIPTSIGVHVYAYGMLVGIGTTVNMSEHGLLLRLDQDHSNDELEPGKYLDIVLEDAPPEQWMPAKVVRRGDGSIAASFLGLEAMAAPA